MALICPEGFLYIRDRAKDVIIRGGENIASAEVENEVFKDDRIAECAAVAVPDDRLGELVGIAVSLAPGRKATPESVLATAHPRLRHPARPVVCVVLDALPRNANGKMVKSDIKKIVAEKWEAMGRAKVDIVGHSRDLAKAKL
jgi:acyl-CoA synthetase (AMP-forming)/AMP-acid ligase II